MTMMGSSFCLGFLLIASLLLDGTIALSSSNHKKSVSSPTTAAINSSIQSRRRIFQNILLGGATAAGFGLTTTLSPAIAQAAESEDDDKSIQVYFGCGCFWHVQHEFVEAEKILLGRSDTELTARAGYAGGNGGMKDDKVCYHNAASVSDYGSLGHAEVVKLDIPQSSFKDFSKAYFALFSNEGYRPDQYQDRGIEYRNLIGIPGGVSNSALTKILVDASKEAGDKLDFAKGKGNDPDKRALAFVMDTADYPFYVAEQYHQFHDGFNIGENYPNSYNGLASKFAKEQTLGISKCPNGLLGLGALGL